MATPHAMKKPGDRKNLPPFAHSTNRDSQAWTTAGAAVGFVQEVDEHASSEAHGQGTEGELHASSQPNPSTLQDLGQGHVSEGVIQSSENVQGNLQKKRPVVARKQVCYPSDVRPVKVYPRSNVEQDPDIERLRSAAAIIHPILNNPIITNSNPRGPRKQKWKAVIKRNLWW